MTAPPLHQDEHGVELDALLAAMTLGEKAAQMAQIEFGSITADEVAELGIGSVMSGGGGNPGDGSAQAWRSSVQSYLDAALRSRLGIPLLYGADAVHGHNNVLGATIFPHNIAMGAAGDADLMRAVARASALETLATGVRWSFAPCLAVPHDIRWGRTYEGFSQRTDLVSALGAAAVEGWHGPDLAATGVLACPKHFLGEGATGWGTAGPHRHEWIDWWQGWAPHWQIDQGDITIDEHELRAVHLPPFAAALSAGALTVMACYASWHGTRIHTSGRLLTEVLKGELGFEGFVVSDWLAVDQVAADYRTAVAEAICAGVDMVMVPFDAARFIGAVTEGVEAERIPIERVDDAVRRILSVKARLGLLSPAPAPALPPLEVVGCGEHRTLGRRAVQASVVTLTDHGALPIPPGHTVLAAGDALDDIGILCGGWSITWQGDTGATTAGSTVLGGLRRLIGDELVTYEPAADASTGRASVGVVSVHELPYAEGAGDRADLSLPDEQVELVRRVRARVDTLIVVVVSGRPLLVEPLIEPADAIVAAWLPGTEADGVAEALVDPGRPTGRLPLPWIRHAGHLVDDARADAPPPWPTGHPTASPTRDPEAR